MLGKMTLDSLVNRRIPNKIIREIRDFLFFIRDAVYGTYYEFKSGQTRQAKEDPLLIPHSETSLLPVSHLYIQHIFDVLGSGWVNVFYGMHCHGLNGACFPAEKPVLPDPKGIWLKKRVNRSNFRKSRAYWQQIDDSYEPIDWQLDLKSGYRWSEKKWSKHIKFAHIEAVDVKVPWELARMHHLPQLAIASQSKEIDDDQRDAYLREFKCQVLDFIATNPPGFGVNWVCAMDIGIRAVNWIIAYELFGRSVFLKNGDFHQTFSNTLYTHGIFILRQLEWSSHRGNHYLADIVSLLFIATFLPSTDETDVWLAFAIQELVAEVDYQFNPDGSHFEGSTAYHCLSAEMVLYATARVLGLSKFRLNKLKTYNHKKFKRQIGKPRLKQAPMALYKTKRVKHETPLPEAFFSKLDKIAEFVSNVINPSGNLSQIGDNDSGRLLKLDPAFQLFSISNAKATFNNLINYSPPSGLDRYYYEDTLNRFDLVAGFRALKPDMEIQPSWVALMGNPNGYVSFQLIESLSNRAQIKSSARAQVISNMQKDMSDQKNTLSEKIASLTGSTNRLHRYQFEAGKGRLGNNLSIKHYPNFGLYCFRSPRLYLLIRCVTEHFKSSGHGHLDQLSLELSIDGKDLIQDPGTYVYTPLPCYRNQYRGAEAHFSPFSREVHSSVGSNVFDKLDIEIVTVEYVHQDGFIATTGNDSPKQGLIIKIEDSQVLVYHLGENCCSLANQGKFLFSPGYGVQMA